MEKSKSKSYYHWIILLCGLILALCNMGNSQLLSPALPFLREKINLSYSQVSLIQTTRQLCIVLATLVMDKVFTKFGVRYGALIAFASAIGGALMVGVASNFAMCLVAGGLIGFGFGLGGMMPASLLFRRWFTKNRGFAIGLCSAGSSITAMIMAAPLTRIFSANSLFAGERMWAIIMAVGAVIFVILVRNGPEEKGLVSYGEGEQIEEKAEKAVKIAEPRRELGKSDRFLLYSTICCVSFLGFASFECFTMATTNVGYDPVVVGSSIALFGGVSMVGKQLYGIVADRTGARITNFIYFGIAIIAHVFFVLMDGQSMFYLYAVVILMALCCYTIGTVGYPIWAADLTDKDQYVKLLKRIQLISTVAGLIINPLPGIVADVFGNYRPFHILTGVLLVYAAFAIQIVYKRRSVQGAMQNT